MTINELKRRQEILSENLNKRAKDKRFICNTCKHKYRCEYYGMAKTFIEQDQNNDMKCERYTKE